MGEVPNDDYPTPQPLANAGVQWLHELFPEKTLIVEPACGTGNFINAARQLWPGAYHYGIDNDVRYSQALTEFGVPHWIGDMIQFAQSAPQEWFGPHALYYGNPPYSNDLPQRFIEEVCKRGPGTHIAFLLRQGFLGGIYRALEWPPKKSLHYKRDVAGRPKFNPQSKSQDHSEYAFFVYEAGYSGHYVGWEDPLIWKASHLKRLAERKTA